MNCFSKRTVQPVSPVLPATTNPNKKFLSNKATPLLHSGSRSLVHILMEAETNSFAKVGMSLLTIIGSL